MVRGVECLSRSAMHGGPQCAGCNDLAYGNGIVLNTPYGVILPAP